MKMRKNLMVGLLAALLAFAGVACGDDDDAGGGGTTGSEAGTEAGTEASS